MPLTQIDLATYSNAIAALPGAQQAADVSAQRATNARAQADASPGDGLLQMAATQAEAQAAADAANVVQLQATIANPPAAKSDAAPMPSEAPRATPIHPGVSKGVSPGVSRKPPSEAHRGSVPAVYGGAPGTVAASSADTMSAWFARLPTGTKVVGAIGIGALVWWLVRSK